MKENTTFLSARDRERFYHEPRPHFRFVFRIMNSGYSSPPLPKVSEPLRTNSGEVNKKPVPLAERKDSGLLSTTD